MLKWAILGMGFIYPRHVQAIEANGGKVVLTCDTDAAKNPDFTDWVEMFNHPRFKEVDAVAICTPNYLHAVMAREARLKGKKVLCEKPLTINGHDGLQGVNAVLQLRYHSEVKRMKANRENIKEISIVAKMFRDDVYWNSWKGNKVKSGGILYNLGIHYIDLLVYILGDDWELDATHVTDKLAKGRIKFGDKTANFHIAIVDSQEEKERTLTVNGEAINLSDHDNLSYEDLHNKVHKHFLNGGIPIDEALKSLELVEAIYEAQVL